MRKIKILFNAYADKHNLNAQNLNAREIIRRLDKNTFESFIFYFDLPDERLNGIENIHLIKLDKKFFRFQKLKHFLSDDYDVIFYIKNSFLDYSYLHLKKLLKDRKMTINPIENMVPYPASKFYNFFAKHNALLSDLIVPISKQVYASVVENYKISPQSVINAGVDLDIFKPINSKIDNEFPKIIYVGSFQKRKRPSVVVEEARVFKNAHFTLIGNGPEENNIKQMVKDYKLDNVTILVSMPQEKLADYYSKSDVFFFPSIHEGFPKVVIEAMACGLPPLVMNSYKPEMIINGVNGFIAESDDEITKYLKILIENVELRKQLSKKAIESAKNYQWDLIVKKWENLINERIKDHGNESDL